LKSPSFSSVSAEGQLGTFGKFKFVILIIQVTY